MNLCYLIHFESEIFLYNTSAKTVSANKTFGESAEYHPHSLVLLQDYPNPQPNNYLNPSCVCYQDYIPQLCQTLSIPVMFQTLQNGTPRQKKKKKKKSSIFIVNYNQIQCFTLANIWSEYM